MNYAYRTEIDPISGKEKIIYMHDMIWEFFHGPIPEGFRVYHKDGDGLNNLLANLDLEKIK